MRAASTRGVRTLAVLAGLVGLLQACATAGPPPPTTPPAGMPADPAPPPRRGP
jgi:hypothetical protein